MPTHTVKWSDVSRHPDAVTAALDANGGCVLITRRGEADLVLMHADRRVQAKEAGRVTAKMLRQLFGLCDTIKQMQVLAEVFPWIKFLPPASRTDFLEDFVTTLDACADLDIWPPMDQTVREWRATAAIHADSDLYAALTDYTTIGDFGSVFPPEVADVAEA